MKIGAAIALALVALVMLTGYFRSEVSGVPAVLALLVSVVLPAAGSVLLALSHFSGGRRRDDRLDRLRRESIEAEILKIAADERGRLTLAEIVATTAIDAESTQAALDSLHDQGLTEIELTDAGQVVHVFPGVVAPEDKDDTTGLLDG